MKLKSLLGLGLLILAATCLPGCATPAQPGAPLGANQARVTGYKALLTYSILMTPADRLKEADWQNELVIPAGPARLAFRYHTAMPGGAIGAASEFLNVAEIPFEAEAGHEYYAEMWGMTIFNMGFKVTDKATGKIVGQAKVKSQ